MGGWVAGGAEVGGCSSVRMSELKSFERTGFWLVGSLCGILSITFELSCWPAPVSNLHQRRTRHSGSSRKDTEIYRVCLRTRGQAGGLRLSALLGEAADLAAAAATESTAGLYAFHPPPHWKLWALRNTDINVAPSRVFFYVENQWPQSRVWQCGAAKINQCSLISRAQLS